MELRDVVTIVLAVLSLFGGAFGIRLVDRLGDRSRRAYEAAHADDVRAFADNEQARIWLRSQLTESESELARSRESNDLLRDRVGELAANVTRLEERSIAQAARIDDLGRMVARLDTEYQDMKAERDLMKAERDAYREDKHRFQNTLTVESTRRQLLERDLTARDQEIDRLKGQLEAVTRKPQEGAA